MASKSNKLFSVNTSLKDQQMFSKMRINREYLLSEYVANELNTYSTFEPFATFNDAFDPKYKKEGDNYILEDNYKGIGAPGVRSIFNKMGSVMTGNMGGSGMPSSEDIRTAKASQWRISNNVPLMDNRANRVAIREHSGCSIKELVDASAKGYLGRNTYDYSDFMYCKYLGKVSNNYLITLRRFPLPVDDYISAVGTTDDMRKITTSQNCQSIGCMVTWLGTPGNDMSNILSYTVSMPFQEANAQLEDSTIDGDQSGVLNGIAGMFDSTYRKQYAAGMTGGNNVIMQKMFYQGNPPYSVSEFTKKDTSKVYGPVDVIKSTYMRGSDGIKFTQSFTLTFDYELRSYNGINGRQALLDLLSNILNVVYTTGTFWGGGYRGTGAHQNNIFANMNIFKTNGGFTDFADAFAKDISNLRGEVSDTIKSNGGLLATLKQALNQLGGMLVGGMLNKLGRPQKQFMNSVLSPAPVGFWHVTVGNPHHPIMSIGNMIIENATIEHYGPLGLDDFPTGLKVTVTLQRAKPRDLRDIEKLYMHGNDRIYTSMGPKVFDMYQNSKEYKSKDFPKIPIIGNADATVPTATGNITISDIGNMKHVMQKYFGHADTYSIYVSACEQEDGAHKKKKKGAGAGNSSRQGGTNTMG